MSGLELVSVWTLVEGLKGKCIRTGEVTTLTPFTKGYMEHSKAKKLEKDGKLQLMVGLRVQDLKLVPEVIPEVIPEVKQAVIPQPEIAKETAIPKVRVKSARKKSVRKPFVAEDNKSD